MAKLKFYRLTRILKENALFNIIFGERSNGKTYSVLEYAITNYFKNNSHQQIAIIRRMEEDFKHGRAQQIFDEFNTKGIVKKLSNGEYDVINFQNSKWWLVKYDENHKVLNSELFGHAFALTKWERDKMPSYPMISTILFDEFITRTYYLPEEFVLFMNVCSTIIRHRDNVKVFMLGNTVNQYNPYFEEFGLTNVRTMKQGDIQVYNYNDGKTRVAVEYSESAGNKPSDVYFAFNNPKLKMITGGDWEIDIYPHLPHKYKPSDIMYTYFIKFKENILQCEIISSDLGDFTYIHRKTSKLMYKDEDLIFDLDVTTNNRYRRKNMKIPEDNKGRKIYSYFINNRVFYQTNEVGEIVRNYLNECV